MGGGDLAQCEAPAIAHLKTAVALLDGAGWPRSHQIVCELHDHRMVCEL